MLDHIGLEVSDVAASKAFYDRALEPLGISVVMDWEGRAFGYGIVDKPDFWIHERGEVGAPVREFTIGSTIQRMLQDVVEIGADVERTDAFFMRP